ncbi:hypothetical protein FD32_GL000660 [Limosilactobacillus panis DSM 6035]|jgi:hypothetical protein|uniref:Uncharacterized protein n=1 Tax=Limosilactobacillus panis DSM 6035 TaxID=1423782 RepID=A0A0R1XBI4_9LACO|nr:hypothetical protein FD32_GL000660 [Limosilactobacillus panis DSM 6035]
MIHIYSDIEADSVANNFFKYDYHDRGKIKWDGFFLSEYTAALKKHRQYIDGAQSLVQNLKNVRNN